MAAQFTVADAAVAVRADLRQYDADLKKAEAEGTGAGSRLAGALKRDFGLAARGLAVGAGALFATALAGGAALTNAMANYRAETGATNAELAEAQKTAVELFRTNTEGFDVIGGVLAKVRTQMGLTGKAQKEATQLVLDYARVTKTDAVEAVGKLDDATDAYNLTAGQQRDLLDKLKLSQEKYGGAVDANLQSLIALAPVLKAANLTYDDGIGLLNLFAQAGVEGADSVAAMTRALAKVKSPEELQKLIDDIQATEDPFLRAQKASDLFGAKAGPKMAQALSVGSKGLGEFRVSTDEARRSIREASKAIESTPLEWLKLQLHNLLGPLAEVAAGIGPVATGIASIGSIAAGLGLDKFVKQFAGKLLEAGKAGGEALIDGIGTATGAAGTIIGNFFASRIENVLDPTKPTIVGRVYRKVAALGGAVYSTAFAAGMKLAEVLTRVLQALPGVSLLRQAILAGAIQLGTLQGTAWSGAFGLALKGGFLLALAAAADEVDKQNFGAKLHDALGLPDIDLHPEDWPWPLGPKGAPDWAGGAQDAHDGAEQIGESAGSGLNDGFTRSAQDIEDEARDAIESARLAIASAGPQVKATVAQAFDANAALRAAGGQWISTLNQWFRKPLAERLVAMGHQARIGLAQVALDAAAGLRSSRGAIDAAIAQLKDDMEHKLTPKKEVAHDIGLLFGKTLSKGLHSADAVVRKQAEGTRGLIEDQLIETVKAGGKAGKKVLEELEQKMHSKDPAVRNQAKRTKGLIDEALKTQPPKTPGDKIAQDLASDLRTGSGPAYVAAYNLGLGIARNILAGIRGSGVKGTGGGSGGQSYHPGGGGQLEFATGTSYVPYDMLAQIHKGEMVIPAAESDRIRETIAAGGGGGDTYQNTWVMPEPTRDPWEVLDATARYVRWGRLRPGPVGG